jgi:hypothetical protein
MLDQLPTGFTTSTQADFLAQWGINELVSEGTDHWESMKNAPDIAAMKMRSRSIEKQLIIKSSGLGGFCVVELISRSN